jgi:hypothetical protein
MVSMPILAHPLRPLVRRAIVSCTRAATAFLAGAVILSAARSAEEPPVANDTTKVLPPPGQAPAGGADTPPPETPPPGAEGAPPTVVAPVSAVDEYHRLDRVIVPLGPDSDQLWAIQPARIVVVDGQREMKVLAPGPSYDGEIATIASTSLGWLLGTSAGVWEMRLNDFDVRFLPELEAEGVYRFDEGVAFTATSLYDLDTPFERYPYRQFGFHELNDVLSGPDTLLVATRRGLRRLLWGRRAWDETPIGQEVETENVLRFVPAGAQNEIAEPDSSTIRTPNLLIGGYHIFYEQSGSHEWRPIEGLTLDPPRRAAADSAYRRLPGVLFQDNSKGLSPTTWRRWVVGPTTVCRIELPDGAVPFSSGRFPLRGEVKAIFEQPGFVWIATSNDLYVIDREYQNPYAFFEEAVSVWGFLGTPLGFTRSVEGEERGWYVLTSQGVTEVFVDSWTWESYGLGRFDVREVRCASADDDGFWIGTKRGLKWFGADRRDWEDARVPPELRAASIEKLEWHRNSLYALTSQGIFAKTRRALTWVKVS